MSEKLKLALFVHDYHLEIGHSNALIEMINHFPQETIDSIHVFAYTCSDFNKLHPGLANKCTHVKADSCGCWRALFSSALPCFHLLLMVMMLVLLMLLLLVPE